MSAAQQSIVLALRQSLYLPLDDLLFITRQYINPDVSRSGLARLLKCEGMSRLQDVIPTAEGETIAPKKTFKDYESKRRLLLCTLLHSSRHARPRLFSRAPERRLRRYEGRSRPSTDSGRSWGFPDVRCTSKKPPSFAAPGSLGHRRRQASHLARSARIAA